MNSSMRGALARLGGAVAVLLLAAACAGPARLPRQQDAGGEVAVRAMSMIGTPYRWGGASPKAGFDCSGLVHYVYQDALGVALPRVAAAMSKHGRRVRQAHLLPGDLVFFNTQRRRYSHVGIYVGNGRFVHSPAQGKRIRLARLDNPYWSKRYNGARRPDTGSAHFAEMAKR